MNLLCQSSVELARGVANATTGQEVEVAVCPPFVYLRDVADVLAGTPVGLGGQNMHFEPSGAYTGEISPAMLTDVGCRYVILGHSERREYFHETDALVNQKVRAALQAGLTPIVCVGERLEQRESGQTAEVVEQQVRGSLAGLSSEEGGKLVIAYEPVWAIGTGRTATPEQAEEVHAQIRQWLASLFGPGVAETIRIQYGGSVKPDNARDLLAQPNIDGALVGGASLKVDSFAAIVQAAEA